MKRLFRTTALLAAAALFAARVCAGPYDDQRPLGVGLMLGAPSGVSVKYWLGDHLAWDAGLGLRTNDLHVHGDLLWHPFYFNVDEGEMPLYLGFGLRGHFRDDRDNVTGIRFPVGTGYHFADQPIEIFVELAPSFRLAPVAGWDTDAAVGVRFYLGR